MKTTKKERQNKGKERKTNEGNKVNERKKKNK